MEKNLAPTHWFKTSPPQYKCEGTSNTYWYSPRGTYTVAGRMPVKQIKEKKLDDAFSLFIRNKYNWTCERCGLRVPPPTNKIQCSHFYSRSIRPTRFEEDNADCFCQTCHMQWENRKNAEYYDWKLEKLGTVKFKRLKRLAYRSNNLKVGGLTQQEKINLLNKYK